jgi:hypothetical protein
MNIDSKSLVLLAAKNHGRFKDVYASIEARAPDHEAVEAIIPLYRGGSLPPWLAAALLQAAQAPAGAELALEILQGEHRLLSESYAAIALARSAGASAESALVRLLSAPTYRTRSAAAAALAEIGRARPHLLDAVLDGRLRASDAAVHLSRAKWEERELADLLSSSSSMSRSLALHLVIELRQSFPQVEDLIRSALSDPQVPISKRSSNELLQRLVPSHES